MKQIIALFVVWRMALFTIAAIAPTILPPNFGKSFPYYQERLISSGLPHFIWAFGNFDGVHYLGIAQTAYSAQYTQAFFPLYPILIKAVSFLVFENFLIAALLVSNVAFLIGLLIFYQLIRKTYDQNVALWSSIFILTFPTSFYFGSVYTESLFFFLTILAFRLAKEKILLASVVGAFTASTRLVGIFLSLALIRWQTKRFWVPLLIVPLGLIAYVLYLEFEFNQPFYFLSSQEIFGQGRTTNQLVFIPQILFRYAKIIFTTSGLLLYNAIFELTLTVFSFAVLILGYRRINPSWFIFSILAVFTPTLTGTFASMPRYILVAFPMFIVLATIKSTSLKIITALIFTILLCVTTALFTQGYWVA